MRDKLVGIKDRYQIILDKLSGSGLDQATMLKLNKERSQLEPIVIAFDELLRCERELSDNNELLKDPDAEIKAMAKDEIDRLKDEIANLDDRIKVLLLPKDPLDEKNVILEIRAGTGGDEACLFAGELYQMYARYAESKRWKVEVMTSSPGAKGGLKEITATISGNEVYSHLKYEAGVHRVQRVPETETQGRVHTSACTVAVLPEAEEIDVKIEEKDIRVDVFRAGGPGGQSVNTTDSAVRITHIPSGLVVQCQDEKSQIKNKAKALKILYARLYEAERAKQENELSEQRRGQMGTGDRSERIRTYNFPQGRVTDHRIGLTLYQIDKIISGDLDEVVAPLVAHYQA